MDENENWIPLNTTNIHGLSVTHETKQSTVSRAVLSPVLKTDYIQRGYRKPYKPKRYYIHSLFQLHNETLNVWTHLIATLVFVYKFIQTTEYVNYIDDVNSLPVLVFSIGTIVSTLFSAVAHLMHSRSEYHHFKYFQIDYFGVNLNAHGVGMIYMFFSGTELFYDHWGAYFVPWTLAMTSFAGVVAMGLGKMYLRRLRIVINITQNLTSCLLLGMPLWYKLADVISTNDIAAFWNDVFPCLTHYILFGISALFYATKIPERFKPELFDLIGHSHQWFHLFISLMSLSQFHTIELLYSRRSDALTSLAQPTVYNTLLPHSVLFVLSVTFIYTTTRITKSRARNEYHSFNTFKQQ